MTLPLRLMQDLGANISCFSHGEPSRLSPVRCAHTLCSCNWQVQPCSSKPAELDLGGGLSSNNRAQLLHCAEPNIIVLRY